METKQCCEGSKTEAGAKPGFFKRLFTKKNKRKANTL